jgi:WD40 repeat protein/Cdc6-like AAA superfamily ATPase
MLYWRSNGEPETNLTTNHMTQLLSPAPKHVVQTLLQALLKKHTFSEAAQTRIQHLIELMDGQGYINYAQAYAKLFPQSANSPAEKTKADKAFKKFRDTLAQKAIKHDQQLKLIVDQNRTADPHNRRFWFEARDDAEARLTVYNEGAIQGSENAQEQSIQIADYEMSYLVIYDEADKKDAQQLAEDLNRQFELADKKWRQLDYDDIPVGELTTKESQQEIIRQADFMLFLLSPKLASQLKEDNAFLDDRPLVPLLMHQIQPDQLTGTVLAGKKIAQDADNKAWIKRNHHKKADWVSQVAEQILDAVEQQSNPLKTNSASAEAVRQTKLRHLTQDPRQQDDAIPAHVMEQPIRCQGVKAEQSALPFLLRWLKDDKGSTICAIFGELGMGKTTLSQRLTRHLLQHQDEPDLPFPVYLDLRHVNSMNWDWAADGLPELSDMLAHILANAYNLPVGAQRPTVEDIQYLAQHQKGLVIFDGLDEVMNRLTPDQCNLFIQRLWSILPPIAWKSTDNDHARQKPDGCGRLLMTCRSHFFQTLQDQINALSGQQREMVKPQDYLWITLLPFNAEQIEGYFQQVFQDDPAQAARIIKMLDEIHDLRELSSRPYNLKLIQNQVEHLEAIQKTGKKISVADLYDNMVDQWTQRDNPKHRLKREHKLLLMERLAYKLWAEQIKSLDYQAIENWLIDQLLADRRWEMQYRSFIDKPSGLDILQQDLRNATFIVHANDDHFRFAHTSIMEYFLARALHRALIKAHPDIWAIKPPSAETLDFLGELIAARDTQACLQTLARLRSQYHPQASELTLHYALHAYQQNSPGAEFQGFQLQKANFNGLIIQAKKGETLNWRGSDLSLSTMINCQFKKLDFTGTKFHQTDLSRSLFDQCQLDQIQADESNLTGVKLHHCSALGADFSQARLYHTHWSPPPNQTDLPQGFEDHQLPDLFTPNQIMVNNSPAPCSITGHAGSVLALAVDPHGQWLASGSDDKTIRLWDTRSGQCHQILTKHTDWIRALAVDPRGQWLASGSSDQTIRLWDVQSGQCQQVLEGHIDQVRTLAVDPHGQWLASGSSDQTIRLWDVQSGQCQQVLEGHTDQVRALAVDPHGQWLASGSYDGTIRLWDIQSSECCLVLKGHTGKIHDLAVDPYGQRLASGSSDRTVRLWDVQSGQCQQVLEGHTGLIHTVAIDLHGQWLASGSHDKTLRFWSIKSHQPHPRSINHTSSVRTLAIEPNGKWLASGENDGAIRLWDTQSDQYHQILEGHTTNSALALAVDPQVQWLASGSGDQTVRLWDAQSGQCRLVLEGHINSVSALSVDPRGQWLASASSDQTVRLWDAQSGQCRQVLKGHTHWVSALAVDPHGQWLASGSGDQTVRLWDIQSGQCRQVLKGHTHWVSALAVDPHGQWLASGSSDQTVRVWDIQSGQCRQVLAGHNDSVLTLVVEPHGHWLASGSSDQTVRLWDSQSGQCRQVLEGHTDWVNALVVDPHGQWLASGSSDQTVRLWDIQSGQCRQVLEGHTSSVNALAVDPHGQWLASGSDDKTIRFWDIRDLNQIRTTHMIERLPEGNWVVWQDPDGPNRRWTHYSEDAWRWLGWHAPMPCSNTWMMYPMEAFQPPS